MKITPMQLIVSQMTGQAPVTYYPQPNPTKLKQRKAASKRFRISDETLQKAVDLRASGMPWDATASRKRFLVVLCSLIVPPA